MSRKGKKRASESTSASPEASTSQLPRLREDPYTIRIEFPPNLPEDQGVFFNNRTKGDLPQTIKGGAFWDELGEPAESSYVIWSNILKKWRTIEYINGEWYYTHLSEALRQYNVAPEDRISQPHWDQLGTATRPYETRGEKTKESPEEESPKEQKTVSDPDEPVATVEAAEEVEQLAGQFHTTDLQPSPHEESVRILGYETAHRIYQEMATAATTMTAPQNITIQAAPPLPPPQAPPQQPPQQPPPQQPPPQQPGGGGGAPPPGGGGGGGAPPPAGPPAGGAQHVLPVGAPGHGGGNGGLQGQPPKMFTGNRKETKDWMNQFTLFAYVNYDNAKIQNPMQRLALALTYIGGDKVREWGNQQLLLARRRVADGMDIRDEQIWELFKADFENTWRDTSLVEDAQLKLDRLEMSKDVTLEDYIANFNALIAELQWAHDHPGTVRAFQQGLRAGLLQAIYRQRPWPNEANLLAWQDAAREEETRNQKIRQNVGYGRKDRSVRESRYQLLRRDGKPMFPTNAEWSARNGRRARDPDAMDVDVAETSQVEANSTFKKLSNEERKRLQSEGRCFLCKKQGHMARNCPNKGKSPGRCPRRTVPFKRKARTTETAEESSSEDSDDMEDVRSTTSDATKVSRASSSKKIATAKVRTAQLTMPTIQNMIQRLSNEEKQEVFDGFINEGF